MKTVLYFCLIACLFHLSHHLQGQNYCNIITFDATKEWIAIVNFNSINNITGSNGGYGDYTNISTSITQGQNYPLTLTPGFANNLLNEYWKVYIDWNQNDVFDTNELVFQSNTASSQSVSTNITVPSGANLGSTRMRVLMRWNEPPIDACTIYDFGEIEDYTLNIVANQACPVEGSISCSTPSTGNTIGANSGNLLNNCVVSTDNAPTHWYVFTGTGDSLSITTCSANTDYDTKLFVYSGDNCNALNCITGNDEMLSACSHSFTHSQVEFSTVPGLTYYILVSGWNTSAGNYQLTTNCTPTSNSGGGNNGGGNNNCPNNLTLNNNITDGTYEAASSVSSDGNINPNNNVNFHAGSHIDLLPNFNVPINTDFSAKIINCASSKPLPNDSIPFSIQKP